MGTWNVINEANEVVWTFELDDDSHAEFVLAGAHRKVKADSVQTETQEPVQIAPETPAEPVIVESDPLPSPEPEKVVVPVLTPIEG